MARVLEVYGKESNAAKSLGRAHPPAAPTMVRIKEIIENKVKENESFLIRDR
jgi:hypothetical protein